MLSALDAFRAQKEAVDQVHARLVEVADLLRTLQAQADAIARNQPLIELLRQEQTLLERAQRTLDDVRAFREDERCRVWPAIWRRWAVAVAFALVTVFAGGGGYAWARHPHEAELARLRAAADIGDSVARRVLKMTPVERRQFDALMKGTDSPNR